MRTVTVLFLLSPFVPGQGPTPATQAPRAVCDFLDVDSAQVQELLLPPTAGEQLTVAVYVDGAMRTLQLRRHDVRSPRFKLLIDDGVALTQVPTPPSVTYRGQLLGEPGSSVAATFANGELRAAMLRAGKVWAVQPVTDAVAGLAYGSYMIYEQQSVLRMPFGCEVLPPSLAPDAESLGVATRQAVEDSPLTVADLAIDADHPFYTARGSSVINVQDDITGVLNAMDVIYNADLAIEHRVTTIVVRTVPTYTSNGHALLDEFQDRWIQSHADIDRDIAHLFSGRYPMAALLGTAYRASICSTVRGYGVTWSDFSSNFSSRVAVTAHELAHSWGAYHCDGDPDCWIMCSEFFGCAHDISSFGTRTREDVAADMNLYTCLSLDSDPVQAPSLTAITPASTVTFDPEVVFLTGGNLDMVTSLTVAGLPVPFTPVAADSLRFTPPAMLDIDTHQVTVSNTAGSDSIALAVTGVQPSLLSFPNYVSPEVSYTYRIHSDREWVGVLGFSLSSVPSSIPGVVDLGLGNSFLNMATVPVFADATGTVQFDLAVPPLFPPFTRTYWQAVMFSDLLNLTLPLEASNLATVWILF